MLIWALLRVVRVVLALALVLSYRCCLHRRAPAGENARSDTMSRHAELPSASLLCRSSTWQALDCVSCRRSVPPNLSKVCLHSSSCGCTSTGAIRVGDSAMQPSAAARNQICFRNCGAGVDNALVGTIVPKALKLFLRGVLTIHSRAWASSKMETFCVQPTLRRNH